MNKSDYEIESGLVAQLADSTGKVESRESSHDIEIVRFNSRNPASNVERAASHLGSKVSWTWGRYRYSKYGETLQPASAPPIPVGHRLLDHCYTLDTPKGKTYCTEPYGLYGDDLVLLGALTTLGWHINVAGGRWHPATVCIELTHTGIKTGRRGA